MSIKERHLFCYSDMLPNSATGGPMDLYSPCETEAEGEETMRQVAALGGHYAKLTIDFDLDVDPNSPQIVVYCATRRPWGDNEVTEAICAEIDKGVTERLYRTGVIPMDRKIPGAEYSVEVG